MDFATVDDLIKILMDISSNGKGDYIVTCNSEYTLAKKSDVGDISDSKKTVDLGGYN